jgi:hypothetical protein
MPGAWYDHGHTKFDLKLRLQSYAGLPKLCLKWVTKLGLAR